METAGKWIRRADRLADLVVYLLIILMLLYAGYALWDNYSVYKGAKVDGRILKFKPTASNPSLSELQKINPDICAWLTINDTKIDYPVLQAEDNSYYLSRDYYGNYSLSGSIFLDYRNDRDFKDRYSVLYGHHMDGGAMFGDIRKFEDEAYFSGHGTGTLITSDRSYDLEIFAVLHEDAYASVMFDPEIKASEYGKRLSYIRESAIRLRELRVNADERIIGLSTCSSATTNGRTIVVAKLAERAPAGGEK